MMRDDDHDATVDFDAHDIDARFEERNCWLQCVSTGALRYIYPMSGFGDDKR